MVSNKVIKFGEDVEGYDIPVLNEREIRASAGLMFLALFSALVLIMFKQDFLLVKYVIVIFLTDFIIRVFVSPRFSPVLIIGRLVVSRQVPEYVGAPQKKFAWKIGLALASLMFLLLVVLNSYSIITAATCIVCLVFLFFESAFGICVGCWMYRMFYKDEALYCVGETCRQAEKDAIQKTSLTQIFIVLSCVVYILLAIVLFNDQLQIAPKSLKEIVGNFTLLFE
jgi:hypothetical protein